MRVILTEHYKAAWDQRIGPQIPWPGYGYMKEKIRQGFRDGKVVYRPFLGILVSVNEFASAVGEFNKRKEFVARTALDERTSNTLGWKRADFKKPDIDEEEFTRPYPFLCACCMKLCIPVMYGFKYTYKRNLTKWDVVVCPTCYSQRQEESLEIAATLEYGKSLGYNRVPWESVNIGEMVNTVVINNGIGDISQKFEIEDPEEKLLRHFGQAEIILKK